MASAPELTFYDFVMGQIENTLTRITDNPKELIKLIAQTKLKRDITQEKYSIKKDIDQIAEFGNMLFNALIKN